MILYIIFYYLSLCVLSYATSNWAQIKYSYKKKNFALRKENYNEFLTKLDTVNGLNWMNGEGGGLQFPLKAQRQTDDFNVVLFVNFYRTSFFFKQLIVNEKFLFFYYVVEQRHFTMKKRDIALVQFHRMKSLKHNFFLPWQCFSLREKFRLSYIASCNTLLPNKNTRRVALLMLILCFRAICVAGKTGHALRWKWKTVSP